MKTIANFFDWLFDYNTNEIFPALFVVGAILTMLVVAIVLFVNAPGIAMLFCAALFFGIPYVGFRVSKAKEQDK